MCKRDADSPDLVLCRGWCCAEGASPFPTTGWVRIRRGVAKTGRLLRGVPGSARPTTGVGSNSPGVGSGFWRVLRGMSRTPSPTGVVRIRPTLVRVAGVAARNAGDGVPYRGCADSPGVGSCFWRLLRGKGKPFPPMERRSDCDSTTPCGDKACPFLKVRCYLFLLPLSPAHSAIPSSIASKQPYMCIAA